MSTRIEEYKQKVARRPQDTLARYVLAKEYFDLGQHDRAAGEFRTLVAQKADWMKCWIHLGQSLKALGQPAEARAAFGEALRLARIQDHTGPAAEIERELSSLG